MTHVNMWWETWENGLDAKITGSGKYSFKFHNLHINQALSGIMDGLQKQMIVVPFFDN